MLLRMPVLVDTNKPTPMWSNWTSRAFQLQVWGGKRLRDQLLTYKIIGTSGFAMQKPPMQMGSMTENLFISLNSVAQLQTSGHFHARLIAK